MIDRPDLDPQDHTNRVALRDQLRQIRKDLGLSGEAVSATAGLNRRAIHEAEATVQWSVRRVARWARVLDHRFRMTITGLDMPELDLDAQLLRMGVPFGGLDEDDLHLLAVVDDLARYRIAHRISFVDVGHRVGVDHSAVRGWEGQPRTLLLKTVQRYARSLGGELTFDVVPVTVAVAS